MKKLLEKTAASIPVGIFLLYFVPMSWLALYYNWTYAREHGFGDWLAFGEIVATGKALAWPYFVFFADRRPPEVVRSANLHYMQSKHTAEEAFRVFGERNSPTQLTPEETKTAVKLLRLAASEAALVDVKYLAEMHIEFPSHYRDQYLPSLKGMADGMESRDVAATLEASHMYNTFADWLVSHQREVNFPVNPDRP